MGDKSSEVAMHLYEPQVYRETQLVILCQLSFVLLYLSLTSHYIVEIALALLSYLI